MGRVVYIASHCNSVKRAGSVLPSHLQSSGQRWCCVRALCSPSLFLPLAIVSENAGDRSAYPVTGRLTRAGDPGPNSSILLGLSARPVCSFLALDPDADVLGSSLIAQEDSDGHWHVCVLGLDG